MTANAPFERRLAAWLVEEAGVSPPLDQVNDILFATSRRRPDPHWLALLKESPMRSNARVVVGSPTRRVALALSLVLSLVLASVVAGAILLNDRAPGDWPLFRGGADRAGAAAAGGPSGNPVLRWRVGIGGVPTHVSIVGDLAFVASDAGSLHALDIPTGTQRWTFASEAGPMTGPAVVDGLVYVVQGDGIVVAIDAASGRQRWAASSTMSSPTTATVGGGLVYLGSADGLLLALDAASGAERWRYVPAGGGSISSPAYHDGFVYAGSSSEGVVALRADTGTLVWDLATGDEEPGTAVVSGGTVYVGIVGESAGRLRAIDARSGALRWTTDESFQSPAVWDGVVYAVGPGRLAAFRADDGTQLWRVALPAASGPPAVAGGAVYLTTAEPGHAYAFDAATGGLLWQYELDGAYACCIAPSHGAVFAGTAAGSVYAIGGDGAVVTPAPRQDLAEPTAPPASEPQATTAPSTAEPTPGGPSIVTPAGFMTVPDAYWVPQTISVDPAGRLWVADLLRNRFSIFEPDGTFIEHWGESGTSDGQFRWERENGDRASGLGFASDGTMFVMDAGNRRVQVFDADRRYLREWGGFGIQPGQFNGMVGLVVGPDDTVHVLDDVRGVVERYDAEGEVLSTFDAFPNATPGAYNASALAIDSAGNPYVSQLRPRQVTRFDPEGDVTMVFGSTGTGPGQYTEQPGFMAVDGEGRLFVGLGPSRGGQPAVYVFDADGQYLGGFGAEGTADFIAWPTGILLLGDTIYVAAVGEEGAEDIGVHRFTLLPPLVE